MTVTERYIILFTCMEDSHHNAASVEQLWRIASDEVYENTGVYIPAIISEKKLVCGTAHGCGVDEKCVQIICVRNPSQFFDREAYLELLKRILYLVKRQMGDSYTTFTVEDIEFAYFASLNNKKSL
jgi:hypothetical protein